MESLGELNKWTQTTYKVHLKVHEVDWPYPLIIIFVINLINISIIKKVSLCWGNGCG